MSLKKLLSLYEFPMKTEELSSSSRKQANTIAGIMFGQHTTCMEMHKDSICQSKKWTPLSQCGVLFRCVANMHVNVDICLYRRNSRNWVGQWVLTQTHKLLVLGPLKVRKKR